MKLNTEVVGPDRRVRCMVVVDGLALGLAPVGPRFTWMDISTSAETDGTRWVTR